MSLTDPSRVLIEEAQMLHRAFATREKALNARIEALAAQLANAGLEQASAMNLVRDQARHDVEAVETRLRTAIEQACLEKDALGRTVTEHRERADVAQGLAQQREKDLATERERLMGALEEADRLRLELMSVRSDLTATLSMLDRGQAQRREVEEPVPPTVRSWLARR